MDGHRRRLLALLGTAGVSNLAGCSFFIGDGESPVETPPQATDEETETETTPEPTPRFENTKLTPQDGDSTDLFGGEIGVSSDGTNVVIGAPLDEDPNGEFAGSAYLFRWEGGEWSEGRKLTPQDGDSDDQFGVSVGVSSDGTTAVIGARGVDNNGEFAGSAYVFRRVGGEWSEGRKLTPQDGDSDDQFGVSVGVSSDGTTAVIGAPTDGGAPTDEGVSNDGTTAVIGADEDSNGVEAGSAYVFRREGGAWTEERKLIPGDGDSMDRFGQSVGVSGDGTTAVIGARGDEDPNGEFAGSAYVFQREGGAWSEERKLTPEDGDSGDQFGVSVGVSGDGTTAVIGADEDEDPNREESGSAYVFQQESGEWREERKLTPEDGDSVDLFGTSVGVSSDGTTAVIGAPFDEDPNGEDAGSAYVFQREGGAWSEERKLTPQDGDSDDQFGVSVGVSSDGTTAVIGADEDEDPNGERAGSAYVFPLGE